MNTKIFRNYKKVQAPQNIQISQAETEELTSFEKLTGQKSQLIPPSSDSSTACIPERVTVSDFEDQRPIEYIKYSSPNPLEQPKAVLGCLA